MPRSGIVQFPYPLRHPEQDAKCARQETEESREGGLIMQRLATGSRPALDDLLSTYWTSVVAYATRMTGDVDVAQDIAQVTFLKAWERRRQWQGGSVRAYLFRIARNLSVDTSRRRKADERALSNSDFVNRPDPVTPDQVYTSNERKSFVIAVVESLSSRRREAFTLVYLRGLTYREAAGVMEVSEKTVGNHLTAAIMELRERLSPLVEREAGSGRLA